MEMLTKKLNKIEDSCKEIDRQASYVDETSVWDDLETETKKIRILLQEIKNILSWRQ